MPSPWTRLRAAADPLTRRVGFYAAYALEPEEYVGTVAGADLTDAWARLQSAGYEPQRLSAAKRHPDTGQLHDLSYRRVPDRHPVHAKAALSNLCKVAPPERCQYHVHAFDSPHVDGVAFYSHYELRPDLRPVAGETWGEALNRLREHYRPTYGETYLQGVTDLDI